MGTWAGFTCAPRSAGCVLSAHLLTFGFPKCGGWQFGGSAGCSLSQGGEGPAAVPPCQGSGTGSRQLAETQRAYRRSEQCHWFCLDWRKTKQASSPVVPWFRDGAEGAIGPSAFLLGGGKNSFDRVC